MAESTPSTSGSSTSSSSSSTAANQPVQTKQYIRASANDSALEPDALRGNEQLIKDLGIQDDEEDRRKAQKKDA